MSGASPVGSSLEAPARLPADGKSGEPLRLAVLQATPLSATTEHGTACPARQGAALALLDRYGQSARAADTSLLVLPELWLSGYDQPYSAMAAMAEPADGPLADAVAAIAQRHRMAIAYGYVEQQGAHYYNSVQVLSARGQPLAHYRKTHLWGALDKNLFSAGDRLATPFELRGWRIGLLICYDVEFPETVRALALQGCDVILVPTALMAPWSFVARSMVPVRAAESQVFIAYANQCGREADTCYVGHSCIADPSGQILAQADSTPALLHAELHRHSLEQVRRDLPYLSDRRPELYDQPDPPHPVLIP